ncbi:MAG: M15 family metallopeptidase [Clostridia bacterium]|nr:M15 family metallopeptidase [Clostridia bacterium]
MKEKNQRILYIICIFVIVFLLIISGCFIYNIFDKSNAVDEPQSFVSQSSVVQSNENFSSNLTSSEETGGLDTKLSKLLLVNPDNALPSDYNYTENLITVDSKYLCGELNQLNKEILPYAIAMMEAASADGIDIRIRSPYRSYEIQERLYNNEVAEWKSKGLSQLDAEIKAATIVARPGTSEHHTGLAIDFNQTNETFEDSEAFQWLLKNAENYGFILRYPEDKQEITKIIYEPWHWRFVGIDVAKEINAKGLCFEEYIEEINNKESVAE